MTEMESHPLNRAHQQHRRADAHLTNNRYDEAMQCHHNAAELLLDAMKSTASTVALESITLQHTYHLKQKDLIQNKKEQYMRVKKAMEQIQHLGKDPTYNIQSNDYTKLPVAIYRTINDTDFLLNQLTKDSSESKEVKVKEVDGKKIEKSQQTVVEELQILNKNLHSLIEKLVVQVEVLKDDNTVLNERINYLEKERVKYLNLPSTKDFMYKSEFDETKDPVPMPIAPQSKPVNQTIDRPIQQPHFDLSALKDD